MALAATEETLRGVSPSPSRDVSPVEQETRSGSPPPSLPDTSSFLELEDSLASPIRSRLPSLAALTPATPPLSVHSPYKPDVVTPVRGQSDRAKWKRKGSRSPTRGPRSTAISSQGHSSRVSTPKKKKIDFSCVSCHKNFSSRKNQLEHERFYCSGGKRKVKHKHKHFKYISTLFFRVRQMFL